MILIQHLKLILQFIARDFTISHDLCEKTTTNRLTTVKGNHCASTIGMLKKMVAAFYTERFKTQLA